MTLAEICIVLSLGLCCPGLYSLSCVHETCITFLSWAFWKHNVSVFVRSEVFYSLHTDTHTYAYKRHWWHIAWSPLVTDSFTPTQAGSCWDVDCSLVLQIQSGSQFTEGRCSVPVGADECDTYSELDYHVCGLGRWVGHHFCLKVINWWIQLFRSDLL